MLWIILAVQLSMPLPTGLPIPDIRAIFSADDMPSYVQQAGIARFVPTRTTVRSDGTAQDCGVERASGDAKLDLYTCAIILKRAKFEPAKWIDGTPAYAIIRVPITWSIGGALAESEVQKAYPPDLELSVNHLPANAGKRLHLALMLAVDESGRVVSCGQWLPAQKHARPRVYPDLLRIACQQMTSQYAAVPAKDVSGKPVRSVQNASVEFSTGG